MRAHLPQRESGGKGDDEALLESEDDSRDAGGKSKGASVTRQRDVSNLSLSDLPMLAFFVACQSFNVLSIAWSKDPLTRQTAYSTPTVVMAAEGLKFSFSVAQMRRNGLGYRDVEWRRNWLFALPALLYGINNNLMVHILRIVPGSVFQMSLNIRTLYTGVLFYCLMGRELARRQWSALVLLVVGTGMCQYANETDASELRVSPLGIVLCFGFGVISVVAGVYSELLLKKGTKSIHVENAQLYAYGIFFNLVGVLHEHTASGVDALRGWDMVSTYIVVFNLGALGVVTSAILKYYDNVIKIFGVTASNFVVYGFNLFVMRDQAFHIMFLAGFVVIAVAMLLYSTQVCIIQPYLSRVSLPRYQVSICALMMSDDSVISISVHQLRQEQCCMQSLS